MSAHTIMAEIAVEITYEYTSEGSQAHVSLSKVRLMDGWQAPVEIKRWAAEWLATDGFQYAVECAETDLNAMRHAQ